jgi:hypothetical protein
MENKDGRKWGVRPDRSRTKQIAFRVSLDELQDLKVEATRLQVNLSDLLRMALARLFGGDPPHP